MNPKEIITGLLDLRETPRLPVSLLSGGAWALNSSGLSMEKALSENPEKVAEILYGAYMGVGSDIVWTTSGYSNIVVGALGAEIKFRQKGTPDVIDTRIKDVSDIDGIDLNKISDDGRIRTLVKITNSMAKKTGGKNYLALNRWGPFTTAGLLYGAENLMRGIYHRPDDIRRLLDFTADLYIKYSRLYIDNGADLILLSEPTSSGDMIARKHFESFAIPAFRKVYDALRAQGVRTALHICGNITDRLDLLNGIGTEFVSVDYKVDLGRCREVFNGKTAFAGNMNPVAVMQRESPEGVEKACRACIAAAGAGPGYMLMPGCDIPPATPAGNIKAMTATGNGQAAAANRR
ncbi:MAG: uroporphyrinogen decarboxylase family protein [Spirochaetaceae bacterium]|jgi:uroporphyrinogen decarboxylase|nr:uroporphyrinogen decarboxylase family protein [Spirochaetaceae bacterium]